jgi:hypothetical protein
MRNSLRRNQVRTESGIAPLITFLPPAIRFRGDKASRNCVIGTPLASCSLYHTATRRQMNVERVHDHVGLGMPLNSGRRF